MPIDTHHHEYDHNLPDWERVEHVVEGERCVKDCGEKYLPRLPGQEDAGYAAYKGRAYFFPATSRTLDGLTGLIFRKAPQAVLPAALESLAEDIDMRGLSLDEFTQVVVNDVMIAPHGGVLVDFPQTTGGEATQADAEAMGWRPYLTRYKAEDVIFWRTGRVNNRTVTTEVRLMEEVEEPDLEDAYAMKCVKQIRQLVLNAAGLYEVALFQEKKDAVSGKVEWVETKRFVPIFRGQPETAIPFVFLGPQDTSPECQKSPLLDIANVNLSHYHNSADYENGLFWLGTPTPIFVGDFASPDGQPVTSVQIGATSGIQMTPGSDAKFLEFQGSGLDALKQAMADKKDDMAVLGARILAADKKAAEAAETAAIHRAGENSVLASLANAVSKGLTAALRIMARWMGDESEVSYKLNTDYQVVAMTPQEITALVADWQAGGLSEEELFEAHKAGEIIRDDKTFEQHKREVETEAEARAAKSADVAANALANTAGVVAKKGKQMDKAGVQA